MAHERYWLPRAGCGIGWWAVRNEPFDCVTESNLQRLLDSVDARDSLAHLEAHRAEEAAVVEAAMAFVAAPVFDMAVMLDLTTACAALRAKRGG